VNPRVPFPAKLLGVLGLIPFVAALFAGFSDNFDQFLRATLNTYSGRLMVTYATIIFCFMSGTFWGFASRSDNHPILPYTLSILPAIYMLSSYSVSGSYRLMILALGFVLLIPIDIYFRKTGLAPIWWLRLRIPLSAIVVLCLVLLQSKHFIAATLGIS